MTRAEVIAIMERITYKPGWQIKIQEDWRKDTMIHVSLSWMAEDSTGKVKGKLIQVGSRHVFDIYMFHDEKSILNRMYWVFEQAERHETMEFFKYNGNPVYDPHAND